jgi:hypothetical protein
LQASAAPRPENSDTDEKYELFGLDTQITIIVKKMWPAMSLINPICFLDTHLTRYIERLDKTQKDNT